MLQIVAVTVTSFDPSSSREQRSARGGSRRPIGADPRRGGGQQAEPGWRTAQQARRRPVQASASVHFRPNYECILGPARRVDLRPHGICLASDSAMEGCTRLTYVGNKQPSAQASATQQTTMHSGGQPTQAAESSHRCSPRALGTSCEKMPRCAGPCDATPCWAALGCAALALVAASQQPPLESNALTWRPPAPLPAFCRRALPPRCDGAAPWWANRTPACSVVCVGWWWGGVGGEGGGVGRGRQHQAAGCCSACAAPYHRARASGRGLVRARAHNMPTEAPTGLRRRVQTHTHVGHILPKVFVVFDQAAPQALRLLKDGACIGWVEGSRQRRMGGRGGRLGGRLGWVDR